MGDEDKVKEELRKAQEELEKRVEGKTDELSKSVKRLEREIYVRRMAEEYLRRSSEKFRSLVETTNDWVWEVDENAVYTYASPQVKALLGYEPEEVLGKTPFGFMSPDEAKRVGEIFSSIAAVKKPFKSLENANLHKDGRLVVSETSGVPCFEANGRFCGYRGVDRDITDRYRAEKELLQSNNLLNALSRAQFQFISDISPKIIFDGLLTELLSLTKSEYGFIGEVFYNDAGEPYLKTHAITNIAWSEETQAFYEKNVLAGLEFRNLKSLFGEVMSTGKPVISNNPSADPRRCGIPEGHPPLEAFLGLPFYKGDRMVGMVGIANRHEGYDEKLVEYLAPFLATCGGMIDAYRNNQWRKKAEEETQRSYHIQLVINALLNISLRNIPLEEQLELAIDQIVSIFWLAVEGKGGIFLAVDHDSLVLKSSRGFTKAHKEACAVVPPGRCLCGRALLSGKIEFSDRIDERHEHRYEGMTPNGHYCVPIVAGKKVLGVLDLYVKEGHSRSANEEEHLRGIANILASIIQRKKGEEELKKVEVQLLQSQKMEAVGQLAGGVAHDFNNLMTVIQGNADLALMKIGEDEPVYRNLKDIGRVTAKAAALTRQLLTFSRRQPMSKEILNINKAVLEMSRMLQRLIGENISFMTDLAPDLWNTEADPGQLEQLLMNLVINARDAMPDGGRLMIKTENVLIDETYSQFYGEGRPGRFVRISVEDTGIGMNAETRARIFEPFFTTKGIGKGTGLGLSVVYGIATGHDGWINVYSEPGKGSNFGIYLPAASGGGIEEKGEERKSAVVRGGNERILLVEDEKGVRDLAIMMLEMQGYKIFAASSYDEAVSIFNKEEGRLDLLFSDVILTDGSGVELANELRGQRPDLKVLFVSGYSGEHFQLQEGHKEDFHFLEKPYTLTELLSVVREVLDQ